MQTLRGGLLAGLLAGLVLDMLNFVTDGTPGRLLPEALHWFGITIANPTISRFVGFAWWLVFSLLLANIMSHHAPFSLDFGRFLSTFPIDLLFGMVLGAIYFQLQQLRR